MTNVPAVFSGGDLTRGPSLVVHAVRDGRRAAQAIHKYCTDLRRWGKAPKTETAALENA
jgi:NADPH-dependent glutamate synthase beta subunit-like oxidoreductase